MGLVAVPYRPFTGDEAADEARNTKILDGVAGLPNMFPVKTTLDERRLTVAQTLVDPANVAWEIWRDGQLVGILLLTRIVRGVDALAHFAFFDKKLVGKRSLLRNMIGHVFRELRLQRLSVELPAHLDPLIRFVRTKLSFKFEGEVEAGTHPALKGLPPGINNPAKWLAHWGSRRERMHFDGTQWHDVVLLRVLASEWETDGPESRGASECAEPTLGDPANPSGYRGDAGAEHQSPELHLVRAREGPRR